MIKQSIIAGAIMALASTAALAEDKKSDPVNTWDVKAFGEVRAYGEVSSKDNVDAEIKSDSTKFGFKVNGQAGAVGVFGELSANVDVNGASDNVTTRFGYVGVSLPKIGNISLGKQISIQEGFVDKADKFYSAGNNSVQKMSFYQRNSIKYTNTIGGVDVGALAAMADGDAGNDNVDRWQIGAGFMGLGVAVGKDANADENYYGVGYSNKFGKIGMGASYTIKDAGADTSLSDALVWGDDSTGVTRGIELAVSYDMSKKMTLTGGYNMTDADADDGNAIGEVAYKISSNAVAFGNVEYDIDSGDHTSRVGISITF
jgi:hypothetical protein